MGIDGGGLFKEFLTSLSKEVFDTNRGLWLVTDENELYPNPHSYAKEGQSPPCSVTMKLIVSTSAELVWIRMSTTPTMRSRLADLVDWPNTRKGLVRRYPGGRLFRSILL